MDVHSSLLSPQPSTRTHLRAVPSEIRRYTPPTAGARPCATLSRNRSPSAHDRLTDHAHDMLARRLTD